MMQFLIGEMMKSLNRSYLFLLVYFVGVYSICILLKEIQNVPMMHMNILLIFLPLYAFMILLIPMLQKQRKEWLIIIGCGLYLLVKLILQGESGLTGYIYTSALEVLGIGLGIWLTSRVAESSNKLQKSIDNVILPKFGHRIYNDMAMARQIVEHEFIRSRRYNHPVTTVVIEPGMDKFEGEEIIEFAVNEIRESLKAQYVMQKLAQIVEEETRITDIVIELNDQDQLAIICPETTSDDIQGLMNRLQTVISNQMGVSINYGVASFPNDAPTFDAVLVKARKQVVKKPNLVLDANPSVT